MTLAMGDVRAEHDDVPVDLELVLAVDISRSMDEDELKLQRDGYIAGLVHPDVIAAIESGLYGRIPVTYVEWAGASEQRIVMPWQLIGDRATAEIAAGYLTGQRVHGMRGTSISAALLFADSLFGSNGFAGTRQVIDISGDGPNNGGPSVTSARDAIVKHGITINGLPLTLRSGGAGGLDASSLAAYYEDCVMGGPNAFVLSVQAPELLADTIRRKMVQEIGRAPSPAIDKVEMTKRYPRIDCEIDHRKRPNRLPTPKQNDFPLAEPRRA